MRPKMLSISLCVTHTCNLNCRYCYQTHDSQARMTFETAKRIINDVLEIECNGFDRISIGFIGGEPCIEFGLIKSICSYVEQMDPKIPYNFFATTNGTLLDNEMKEWFLSNKAKFTLGLSLDGNRDTHNYNRPNSFDKIDLKFFADNWPNQSVKMTLSEYSLEHFAESLKFIHASGFNKIAGVNLGEAYIDWNNEEYVKKFIPQLVAAEEYYLEHPQYYNQMFDKKVLYCEYPHKRAKWCGIGTNMQFYDTDGTKYPCAFITPMTFNDEQLTEINSLDFSNSDLFIDEYCYNNCYIYPLCATCSGANYKQNGCFSIRDKSKCRINKLVALFLADYTAKRILSLPEEKRNSTKIKMNIEAIKKIKELFYPEFKQYFEE